jgi:LmbE family N-acetylglucosaminyl deacetylase
MGSWVQRKAAAAERRAVRTRFLLSRQKQRYAEASPAAAPRPWASERHARVLVVASHADDEVIGCGGLLRQHAAAGSEVSVVFVTRSLSRTGKFDRRRLAESRRAQSVLGYQKSESLGFVEESLDPNAPSFADLTRDLAGRIHRAAPTLLLIPNDDDFHNDHAAVARACRAALAMLQRAVHGWKQPETLVYEIWGPCTPDIVVPLPADVVEVKRRALECYKSQLEQIDYHSIMGFIQSFRGRHLDEEAPRRAPRPLAAEAYERLELPAAVGWN